MDLLILGGSGFVSGETVRQALERGHRVWTVTRGSRETVNGVTALCCDRNDTQALQQTLMSCGMRWDAVIDCICFDGDQARADVDVVGKFTSRFVVISTDSVYHPAAKRVLQDEAGSRYLTDGGYGAKKREMEEVFLASPETVRWTLLRPGHIFGPGSKLGCFPEQSRQADLIDHMRAGRPLRLVGGGNYLIHPTYVGNLARVLLDCAECPAS